jgi:hypothetical protein
MDEDVWLNACSFFRKNVKGLKLYWMFLAVVFGLRVVA